MNRYIRFHEYLLELLGIFYDSDCKWYLPIFKNVAFLATVMFFYTCGLVHLFCVVNDFTNFAEDMSILLVGFMGMVRFGTLINSKKKMMDLRDAINQDSVRDGEQLTSEDYSIIEEYDKDGLKYSKIYALAIFVSTQGMLLYTLPGMFLGHGRHLPLPVVLPFDISTTMNFTLAYLYSALCTNIFVLMYAAFDTWFIFLVYHACGHFCVLQNCLVEIANSNDDGFKINERIARCVRLHQNVYKFSAEIENTFCVCNLAQFIVSSVSICTSGYEAVTVGFHEPQILAKHLPAIFDQITLSFVFNWCGELVREKSFGVSLAISESKFYKLNANHQRDLSLIMLRAQTPTYMTAGKFFDLSLANFTNFLKTSMSYFTMLTSVQEAENPQLIY